MLELELTRTRDDRRAYRLGDLGTLRLGGITARTAHADAGGRRWTFSRQGFWRRTVRATGEGGAASGQFAQRSLRRGGPLRWGERELALRPASRWRERYALVDGDVELAVFDARGWGRRPVRVTITGADAVEPGLLLFAAFVVRGLASDASAAAAGGASVAAGA
jgi:hypothetical protein